MTPLTSVKPALWTPEYTLHSDARDGGGRAAALPDSGLTIVTM